MKPSDAEVRHGYTLADIDRLARVSVEIAWPRAMDYTDRYEAAWHAIAEHLCSTDEVPSPRDLKVTGTNAVNRLAQDEGHHHGFDRSNPGAGFEGMPRFQQYWAIYGRATPSHEDGIVDRIALAQIWPALSPTHRQALLAFAVHTDHDLASNAMGRTLATYRTHLANARRQYRALWHEHEAPSRMWGSSYGRMGCRTGTQVLVNRRQQRARRAAKAGEAA